MVAVRPRHEIPVEHTWNAESVFENRAAWNTAAENLLNLLPVVAQYQGRLGDGANVLADFQEKADEVIRLLMKLYFYATMSAAVDSNDKEAAIMQSKVTGMYGQTMAALAFSQPEILAIGRDTLETWMQQETRLGLMRQYVDNLFRQQQHVRSVEVEQVMGLVGDPFATMRDVYDKLTNADLVFKAAVDSSGQAVPVAQSNISSLMHHPDREVRRTAWENYCDEFLAHKNTLAGLYLTSVKQDVFEMRVRGFKSSLEASLFENNIPREVFDSLINTYKENIPTWHRYWAVRRKALGVDTLHPYDIWAPVAAEQPDVPYTQSVDWISAGLAPLGEEYVNVLRKGCLEERWVDIYPNEGKSEGAFSFGTHDTHPFIMMSYDDTLGGMSTLAHELGHSMHSYLSRQTQPRLYSGYSLFIAEVASNFNQAMTRQYLREQYADDANFQIALIEEAMSNFHRYFFIMPTLARFELEVHERVERGEGVNADDLIELMTALFKEGYGDEMHIDHERVGITWATFGHLYSAFYVYQYATGISAAHALADAITEHGEDAAKRYREALSAGSSMYALDALLHAGVDMRQPDAVKTTFSVLAGMVDRLEQLTS
ncbi:MAG: oligoendopeptidase F [Anaerolineae bacterium]